MRQMSRPSARISHDPFLLTNVAHHGRGLGDTLRGSELEQRGELEPIPNAPLSLRAIAWRVIGVLGVLGAFFGLAAIARHDEAREAIIDWITFGVGAPDRGNDPDVQKGVDEISKRNQSAKAPAIGGGPPSTK